MEKILLVLSRVNEYECHREISLFEKYLNKLKSKKDEYLIYEFLDLGEENTKTQIISNKTTGKSNNVSSIYLSSRISTQKLKKLKIYMINISTILIVSVFFIVVLVFSSFLNTNLNGALILQEKTSKFTESSNIIGSLQNIIFSYNSVDENLIENEENLNKIIKIYYENVDEFIVANQKFIFQFSLNDLIPESNIIELNSVIKNNICLNSNLNKYCNLLKDNNFLYGLNGYIQNYIKLVQENLIFIKNYKENKWDKIYDQQNLRESLINSVIFYNNKDYLEELVQNSIESIINKIYNNLLLLFLLGGSGCSLILCLIYSLVYLKIKQDFKSLRIILLLIPFKKLKEDSTLYLLRNLKKF